jgi:hypothetical protein
LLSCSLFSQLCFGIAVKKTDCSKWTQESKLSAVKAFKIDGLPPAAAIET